MQELEEDADLRARVALYRDPHAAAAVAAGGLGNAMADSEEVRTGGGSVCEGWGWHLPLHS